MLDELFYPNERKCLWTQEMIFLSLSNLLLYISLYMFLPTLPYWLTQNYGCSLALSSTIIALFAVAIFLPGPCNNYLLDAYKRKGIAFWCSLFLGLTALGYLVAVSLSVVLALRVAQGILFSIITTTTGSTLVIDVTPTKKRTSANFSFTRIGRLGMILGVISGIYLWNNYNIELLFYTSAALTFLSSLMILFIRVPFRAPLKPSLFSLDRFLLPRALPVAFNMIATPIILGILITMLEADISYLWLSLAFTIGFLVMHILFRHITGKRELELSTLFVVIGFTSIIASSSMLVSIIGYMLLGLGSSITANRFYAISITIPMHCERGSANNTYNLIWEVGILIGLVIGFSLEGDTLAKYWVSIGVILCSLLLYEFKIVKFCNELIDDK